MNRLNTALASAGSLYGSTKTLARWPGLLRRGRVLSLRSGLMGLVVGAGMMVAKRYAMQALSQGGRDWDEVLRDEHRTVDRLFTRLETAGPRRRPMIVAQIRRALAKHSLQEENVIYPAFAKHLGEESAQSMFSEHADIKLHLDALSEARSDDPMLLEHARKLRRGVHDHVVEEEAMLSRLKRQLTADQNKHLTSRMRREVLWLA